MTLFEQLSIDFPADALSQSNRAMSLETVAVWHKERGDLAGARTLLEQATVYAQKACELHGNSKGFRAQLESSRRELAALSK